jgi:hypothetical protein
VSGRALTGGPATSATKGGTLTVRAQRQGTRALIDGPRRRARVREAAPRDLGRAIEIGQGRSNREGANGCGRRRSSSLRRSRRSWGRCVLWRFRGRRSWSKRGKTTRRARWRGCGHETGVREGRTAGKRLRAGRSNSGEGFWLQGEGLRRTRA